MDPGLRPVNAAGPGSGQIQQPVPVGATDVGGVARPERTAKISGRNAHLDRLRIVAAYGIVCFHTTAGAAKDLG